LSREGRKRVIAVYSFGGLEQGFLTWGAEINFRGCWERNTFVFTFSL